MNKKYYKYIEIIENGEIKDKGYFESYEEASKYLQEIYPELTKKYGLSTYCLKSIRNNRIRMRKKGPQVNEIIRVKEVKLEEIKKGYKNKIEKMGNLDSHTPS